MRIVVACAPPGAEAIVTLDLPAGSTVADAVLASGLPARLGLDPASLACAIHGQRASPQTPLADGDRVELLPPLRIDAKSARHQRVRRARAARDAGGGRTGPGNGG